MFVQCLLTLDCLRRLPWPLEPQGAPGMPQEPPDGPPGSPQGPENQFLHEWARHARSRGHPVWILLRIVALISFAKPQKMVP